MAHKFAPGDSFRAIKENSNGTHHTGKIYRISFNAILQDDEYIVEWDHYPKGSHICYNCEDGDREWEHYTPTKLVTGSQAVLKVNGQVVGSFNHGGVTHSIGDKVEEIPVIGQVHRCEDYKKWYPGFIHGYYYCEKCGEKI